MSAFAAFLVRLDAVEERGEDRALMAEQWERPPEEWERFRAVRCVQQSPGFQTLRMATAFGMIEIVPQPGIGDHELGIVTHTGPPSHPAVAMARHPSNHLNLEGVGLTISDVEVACHREASQGRRPVEARVSPSGWAQLNRQAVGHLGWPPPPLQVIDVEPSPADRVVLARLGR